jgi:hypothetical protein
MYFKKCHEHIDATDKRTILAFLRALSSFGRPLRRLSLQPFDRGERRDLEPRFACKACGKRG